jgi:DNA topoisomerase-1
VKVQGENEAAMPASLRYVTDAAPGILRKRKGTTFEYYNSGGKRIKDRAELKRIASLVIPPAWERVWICPRTNGHLQATGIDSRGRKQYSYHREWRAFRDEAKFERLLSFAKALPKIRKQVARDLRCSDLTREKVLATVVRLLETSLIRIGNEGYAKENRSFGLTTMRNRHVKVNGATVQFQFHGKGGKRHTVALSDFRIARIIRKCQELPGQKLFEHIGENNQAVAIGSEDVNQYLQEVSGQPFTAKDFRTWAGTVLALEKLGEPESESFAKRNIGSAIEAVARFLGNTVAVCRKCYIHPGVTERYLDGTLIGIMRSKTAPRRYLKAEEAGLIALLKREKRRSSNRLVRQNGGTPRIHKKQMRRAGSARRANKRRRHRTF